MKRSFFYFLLVFLLISAGCARQVPPYETPPPVAPAEVSSPAPSEAETVFSASDAKKAREEAEERRQADAAAHERENALLYASHRVEDAFGEDFPAMEFVLWLESGPFSILPGELRDVMDEQELVDILRKRTGESMHVLTDRFYGLLDSRETAAAAGIYIADDSGADGTVLAFTGDVNLVDGGKVVNTYRAAGGRLDDIFPDGLLEEMRAADVLVINNEFAFTSRGSPIPGKEYTFRSRPENVSILTELGVDVACLANNHIYDFGEAGLFDTLDTLDRAGIARYGAGRDIREAEKPVYYIAGGMKIAILGASCIDLTYTRVANRGQSGVLRARENNADIMLEAIRKAKAECDFVVTTFHWGFENTTKVEAYQRQLAKMCIDAGADAVIGTHPHILQGAEFHNGKPIIYSLSNYWFSSLYRDTGLLKLNLEFNGGVTVQLLPCETGGGITVPARGEAAERICKFYESISFGVNVSADGVITPR